MAYTVDTDTSTTDPADIKAKLEALYAAATIGTYHDTIVRFYGSGKVFLAIVYE